MPVAGTRSDFLMKIAYTLAESDLTSSEIATLVQYADQRVGKFKNRQDAELRYAEIAAKAFSKVQIKYNPGLLLSPMEILNSEETLDWIVEGWLHKTGFMLLTGQPGVGKTQFSIDMETHLTSTAEMFVGRKILTNNNKAFFVSLEMQPVELKYIYQHQIQDASREPYREQWDQNVKVYAPIEGYDSEVLERLIEEYEPQILFVDSLSELFSEDMKEAEARKVLRHLMYLRRRYSLAIVAIHHNRKASDTNKKPTSLSDLYGTFLFAKTVETVVCLWEDKEGGIDMYDIKTRFGAKQELKIDRTPHLTFNVRENVNSESERTDPTETDFGSFNLGFS